MKALVFYARAYSFVNTSGEQVTGNQVAYLEEMDALELDDEKGLPPLTVSMSESCVADVLAAKLPAVCDIELSRRPGRRGKPESILTSFKVSKPWNVRDLLSACAPTPSQTSSK